MKGRTSKRGFISWFFDWAVMFAQNFVILVSDCDLKEISVLTYFNPKSPNVRNLCLILKNAFYNVFGLLCSPQKNELDPDCEIN